MIMSSMYSMASVTSTSKRTALTWEDKHPILVAAGTLFGGGN